MKLVCIFFVLSTLLFSDNVNSLKNRVKKIDGEIQKKNKRIESIDSEKESIAAQIEQITLEIAEIKKEGDIIQKEITSVNKNIDYGEQNLNVSNDALKNRKNKMYIKLLESNKKSNLKNNSKDMSIAKRNFAKLIMKDLDEIDYIETVQITIGAAKNKIESDKKRLDELRYSLHLNKQKVERKKAEKNILISKLNSEKSTHVSLISRLSREKNRIEKEIDRVIKSKMTYDSSIKLDVALLKLGKLSKPTTGVTVVGFKDMKNSEVSSNGIEISGKLGNLVSAATDGEVIYADKFQGLNHVVMIDYGYNVIGIYGNLISYNVKPKQKITRGQELGILGLNTNGQANFYYEVRFNLKSINPERLFR